MNKFPINKDFNPFDEISKPLSGNRYVITDIHGFFDTFLKLIYKIGLNKNDQLFLLGDLLDRGKKGRELFDWILLMLKQGYGVFPLRGNHEDMMWLAHQKEYDAETLRLPGNKWGKDVIDKQRKILPKYVNLASKLPYYYILDKFYLVHAGFNFSDAKPFENFRSMVWIKESSYDESVLKNKTLIHGHSKRTIERIQESVDSKEPVIGLDNATYLRNNKQYGRLVCLNLDTNELFIQQNIDK